MIIKSFLISSIFALQLTICFGQGNKTLSKKEMREDFEYLEQCIDSLNPHLSVFNKLMGYNVEYKLKEYKKTIDTVSSVTSFFVILKKALNLIQEEHARFVGEKECKYPSQFYLNNYPNFFTEANKKSIVSFYRKISDLSPFDEEINERLSSCHVFLSYINGKYYNVFPVWVCNGADTTKIQAGYELTCINRVACDSFLYTHLDDYLFGKHSYDISLKKFYDEMLTSPLSFLTSKDDLILTFKENNSTPEFSVRFSGKGIFKIYTAQLQLGIVKEEKCPKVLLIGDILYVKIPKMDLSSKDFYQKKIREFRNSKISKVVLDVRDNKGGSDYLWYSILDEIMDIKLDVHFKLGFRNTQLFQPFLEKSFKEYPYYEDTTSKVPYRLLSDNNEIAYSITPSDSSIRFTGKIFVLHNRNTFSAANSLVTLANCNDRLISVGELNGKLGGYGIDPKLFQLPNSKLIFQMHATIHIPDNPKSIEDYFWNKTELPVVTNPMFENIIYEYQDKDIYTEGFLLNKDIYFKKVLEYCSKPND